MSNNTPSSNELRNKAIAILCINNGTKYNTARPEINRRVALVTWSQLVAVAGEELQEDASQREESAHSIADIFPHIFHVHTPP